MQVLNFRRQFIADHSSTNYLFYAAKPISNDVIQTLSPDGADQPRNIR